MEKVFDEMAWEIVTLKSDLQRALSCAESAQRTVQGWKDVADTKDQRLAMREATIAIQRRTLDMQEETIRDLKSFYNFHLSKFLKTKLGKNIGSIVYEMARKD